MAESFENLRKSLEEENAKARLDAAFELAKLGQIQELKPVFVELLQNRDPDLRAEAAHRLGWIGTSWSVDQLGSLVNDVNRDVRHDSIFALAETCRVSAGDRLAEGLLNRDLETREDARVALVALLGQSAAEGLDFILKPKQEYARFMQWWVENQTRFDVTVCYAEGEITDVRRWIDMLRDAPRPVKSWMDERLRYWTGFVPGGKVGEATYHVWNQWYKSYGGTFKPGNRYFFGHAID